MTLIRVAGGIYRIGAEPRGPRTALPMLGPWAPARGPIVITYHDGRQEDVTVEELQHIMPGAVVVEAAAHVAREAQRPLVGKRLP